MAIGGLLVNLCFIKSSTCRWGETMQIDAQNTFYTACLSRSGRPARKVNTLNKKI